MATELDARGKACPMPIVLIHKSLKNVDIGGVLRVVADDAAFSEDVRAWCRKTEQELVSLREENGEIHAEIRRLK